MLGSEAVSIIAARLGNRGTVFNTQILTELNAAQEEMQTGAQLPWFLLNHDTTTVTVAATKTLAVPTGFLLEDDYGKLFLVDADGGYNLVVKNDYDVLRKSPFFDTSAIPQQYALVEDVLFFYPTPDIAYTFDWHYYKNDNDVTTAAENAWLKNAPMVLLNKAGMEIARFLRDSQAVALFSENYSRAIGAMWVRDEARRQAGAQLSMGG